MKICLLFLCGGYDGQALAREYLMIERSPHCESRADQEQRSQSLALCFVTGGLNYADKRQWRASADLIEHNVGRVGSQQGEVGARAGQPLCRSYEIPREFR